MEMLCSEAVSCGTLYNVEMCWNSLPNDCIPDFTYIGVCVSLCSAIKMYHLFRSGPMSFTGLDCTRILYGMVHNESPIVLQEKYCEPVPSSV